MRNFKIGFGFPKMATPSHVRVAIITSLVTFLVILGILFLVVWTHRGAVFNYFAREYVQQSQNGGADAGSTGADAKNNQLSGLFSQQSMVVDAVKKANPAVVSIVISKEVPKYSTSYQTVPNPFGDFFGGGFPGFNFQMPQQQQNGTEKKEIGGGSGFLVSADGLIVTNRHVVDDKTAEYTVFTNDGKKHDAKVVARDAVLDVALIKIDGRDYPYLTFADSDKLELGQSVVAIGNALAQFRNSVSVGVVSGLSRSITAGDNRGQSEALSNVIQTDAAINPGNSGGPLLDLEGHVIGVNVAIVQGSENIGFALPINSIESTIQSVKDTGKIVRPYVGIRYVPITSELKEKNSLSVDYGILVQRGETKNDLAVIPGSPADKAGIVENDIVLEVDGTKLDEDHDLATMIRGKKVGDTVTFKILHRGDYKTVSVKLEAAPQS